MKKKTFWWILCILGLLPFAAPWIGFVYERLNASSWTLADWLLMYSVVYWPTYLLGLLLLAVSAGKLRR